MKSRKFIILIIYGLIIQFCYSQDTLQPPVRQDTLTTVTRRDSLLSFRSYLPIARSNFILNKIHSDTITLDDILWLPLKNTEDIFSYSGGFFLRYMDVGQIQNLSLNQLDYMNIGLYRNDRQLNDLYDGTIDFTLLSKAEIELIENSKMHSASINNHLSQVNIIQHQVMLYRPYSEINFQQDRYDNLFIDANFHQNFSQKLNFNFGMVKHSYTGKYVNSEFDKWLGRLNLNFFPVRSLHLFTNINYAKIDRDLNEGLDISGFPVTNKEILLDAQTPVVNDDAYEVKERFDIDAGFNLSGRKNITTKLRLFVSNSFRQYRDPTSDEGYIKDNNLWINYGARISQLLYFRLSSKNNIYSTTEAEYNYDIVHDRFANNNNNRINLQQKVEFQSSVISLNSYIKLNRTGITDDKFNVSYGAMVLLNIVNKTKSGFAVFGKFSEQKTQPPYIFTSGVSGSKSEKIRNLSAGFDLKYFNNSISGEFYYYNHSGKLFLDLINNEINISEQNFSGVNVTADIDLYYFNLAGNILYNVKRNDFYPQISGLAALSYRNRFFNNKLEVKGGVQSRFWTEYTGLAYNGRYNIFSDRMRWSEVQSVNTIERNFTFDVFLMGKLDRAAFSFVFENVFNRALLNTSLYPFIGRGGFANALSRFTLTWYLFN